MPPHRTPTPRSRHTPTTRRPDGGRAVRGDGATCPQFLADPNGHRGCILFLTFHGLRHSATIALAATKDVIAVSRTLGHASTEFTMDVYGHVLEKQQHEIADYMDAAVTG